MTKKYSITKKRGSEFPVPEKGQVIYWDKTPGLGLRITSAGARSWIVQGYVNGKPHRFTLAPLMEMDHEDARDEAAKIRGEMRKGINPLVEKRKAQKASAAEGVTLREIMEDYIENKRTEYGPLRPSTKQGIKQNVEKEFASWADKPVATINRDMVLKKFNELSKSAPTQTNLAFRNLRALLYWAREKYVTEDGTYTILPLNPVSQALKNGGRKWNKERARETRIGLGKIGAVWLLLEEYADIDRQIATTCTSADLIAFMLLTGCRVGEANQLTWDRVKLDDELPTFHLEITKNHNPITLPISDALHTVLTRRYQNRQQGNPYVFPAMRGKKGFLHDPRAMMRRVIEVAGVSLCNHDMRRTFLDIAKDAGVDSDTRRILTNHKRGGDVHATNYENNKDPEMLMVEVQKVSKWVLNQADIARAIKQGENVVPLKAT